MSVISRTHLTGCGFNAETIKSIHGCKSKCYKGEIDGTLYHIKCLFERLEYVQREIDHLKMFESITAEFTDLKQIKEISNCYLIVTRYLTDFQSMEVIIMYSIKITEDLLVTVCTNLTNTLKHMHSNGMVHLDIKPGNIMVNPTTGEVKLVDFETCSTVDEFNTKRILWGTYDFIDPCFETLMYQQHQFTFAELVCLELFSLGVTLYQFLTRSQSFSELSTNDINIPHVLKLGYFPSMMQKLQFNIFPLFSFNTNIGRIDYTTYPFNGRTYPTFE